jgi:hypothetical protein
MTESDWHSQCRGGGPGPPGGRRHKNDAMDQKLVVFLLHLVYISINESCETPRRGQRSIKGVQTKNINMMFSCSEFPKVTFSVSATTTGYGHLKHKKKSRAITKPKSKAVRGSEANQGAESNIAICEGLFEGSENTCESAKDTVEMHSPPPHQSQENDISQPSDMPSTLKSDQENDVSDVDDGASCTSSDSAESAQEDETAMMKALGLPVIHPNHRLLRHSWAPKCKMMEFEVRIE